jgi:hypothetical protein
MTTKRQIQGGGALPRKAKRGIHAVAPEVLKAQQLAAIKELLDAPELIKYMKNRSHEDDLEIGVVTIDNKEGTVVIWWTELMDMLVQKGEVKRV